MSLNLSLSPDIESRVQFHLASGRFASANELIREALHLFDACHDLQTARLKSLQQEIALGVADIEAGRVELLDMADIKQQGRAMLSRKASCG